MIRPAQGIEMLRKFVGFCILGAFASPLWAQMTVAETLQACEISAETLVVSDCDVTDFTGIVEAALEDLTGRQELETRRDAWAQAKINKQQLLEQLSDSDQSQDYEGVLQDLQTASNDVEQAKASYFQHVDSMRDDLIDDLSLGQQAKLELSIRPEVHVLPAEYRLLPWDARKLTRLTRAVRMAESDEASQHPLITAAEASYEVQYARQLLLQNLESMKIAFDAL